MAEHYILDEQGEPKETDLLTWGRWMEDNRNNRHVGNDILTGNVTVQVSTVFLGLNHALRRGAPILWETMIFGGPHDGYQNRYHTREEALAGHAEALKLAQGE